DLERPERFVGMVCDRLHEHLRFGWLAMRFADDRARSGPLASRLLVRGTAPGSPEILERAMTRLESGASASRSFLADGRADLGLPSDARVIVQPILRGG